MTRNSWADLALQTLARSGPEAVTVANLCSLAQKTKGSFYYHFKDHNALLHAAFQRWETTHTQDIIQTAQSNPNTLHTLAQNLDPAVEQSVRRLAARTPSLQPYIERVDSTRIQHLTHIYTQRFPSPHAQHLAEIEYALFLGTQQLSLPPTHLDALHQTFTRLVEGAADLNTLERVP